MNLVERNKLVYEKALEFLLLRMKEYFDNPEKHLERYLKDQSRYETINDANRRLIQSMSNRNMMASVIAFNKRSEKISKILFDYDSKKIINTYPNWDILLKEFVSHFPEIDVTRKWNLWQQFSDWVISWSKFMSVFKDKEEFDYFVGRFSLNIYTKASLPMLLEKEIKGFWFALACDFLKELWYRDYPKPDVHLIKIFYQTWLCNSKEQYDVYKSIIEMCDIVWKDAYSVDKIFWLIWSWNFYLDEIKIWRSREDFIESVLKDLNY